MARGRPRVVPPNLPAHIDYARVPPGILWDRSGQGRWYVLEQASAGERPKRTTVAGPATQLKLARGCRLSRSGELRPREGGRRDLEVARPVVVGDSAGANLALGLALRHPERVAATVLVYPFLDPDLAAPSYDREDGGGLSRAEARWYWQQYVDSPDDLAHPDLAPLRSDRERLGRIAGPVLVQAAEHDPLVDENRLLVDRLADAGVDVRVSTYPGMVHGFWRHPQLFDAAEQALAEIADFLRRPVDGADGTHR